MRKINFAVVLLLVVNMSCFAQFNLNNFEKDVKKAVNPNKGSGLSNDDIVHGLKDALTIGSQNSANKASVVDGYFKNSIIKIPFPKDAQNVENTAREVGMGDQVDKFVLTMNRAAEDAAKSAAPIFVDAVKNMTFSDALGILRGNKDAATVYLRNTTSAALKAKFKPVIQASIDKVEVTKYWRPIIDFYNQDPFVDKINPDLNEYICQKALDGLFYLISQEELKIRTDPMAQVTDILKKVFGS
jgi:hypothetical protein